MTNIHFWKILAEAAMPDGSPHRAPCTQKHATLCCGLQVHIGRIKVAMSQPTMREESAGFIYYSNVYFIGRLLK